MCLNTFQLWGFFKNCPKYCFIPVTNGVCESVKRQLFLLSLLLTLNGVSHTFEGNAAPTELYVSPDIKKLFNVNVLLPRTSYSDDHIQVLREVADACSGLLGLPVSSAVAEYQLWVAKWNRLSQSAPKQTFSTCLMQIIEQCDNDLYPSINCLLRILATLPVSVGTGERRFSKTKLEFVL